MPLFALLSLHQIQRQVYFLPNHLQQLGTRDLTTDAAPHVVVSLSASAAADARRSTAFTPCTLTSLLRVQSSRYFYYQRKFLDASFMRLKNVAELPLSVRKLDLMRSSCSFDVSGLRVVESICCCRLAQRERERGRGRAAAGERRASDLTQGEC